VLGTTTHVIDQFLRIAADLVDRRIDEDIWILHDEREHLTEPGHADVAADDAQFGKLERNAIEIRDGPPGSDSLSGPACPTCVQNGMSSSQHSAKSG
jgi:hypothetical protein